MKPALLIVAFISGFVIMVLEMLGFRILAPSFGYSIYVWGILIGIIMLAFSVGYYIGGKIADLRKQRAVLIIMVISILYIFLITYLHKSIINIFLPLGINLGSLVTTILIFFPPMLLLSMITPIIIRLLANYKIIGFTSGKVYAITTLGNILGVILATFVFIPVLGTILTFHVCSVSLLITLPLLYKK